MRCLRQVPEVRRGVRCPTGEARITPGFDLPARHVIHTVGPVYDDAEASAPLLAAAYRSSLRLANERGLKTIAFPAISCGVYGYPYDEAGEVCAGWAGVGGGGIYSCEGRARVRQTVSRSQRCRDGLVGLQIAARTCLEEAGQLEAITFYLFGDREFAAFAAALDRVDLPPQPQSGEGGVDEQQEGSEGDAPVVEAHSDDVPSQPDSSKEEL